MMEGGRRSWGGVDEGRDGVEGHRKQARRGKSGRLRGGESVRGGEGGGGGISRSGWGEKEKQKGQEREGVVGVVGG